MTSFEFVLEGAPVPCARARVVRMPGRRTRAVTPAKTANYEQAVGLVALAARPAEWRTDWAEYAVRAYVYRQERRGDADNFCKALLDGMQGVAFDNDSRVTRVELRIFDGDERPRAEVLVEMLGDKSNEEALRAGRRARASRRARA